MADAFTARSTVLAAADALDEALADGRTAAMERASLAAGSASAVRSGPCLDRFWRNARTLVAHNPTSYKLRVLGEHALNGTPPPIGSFL